MLNPGGSPQLTAEFCGCSQPILESEYIYIYKYIYIYMMLVDLMDVFFDLLCSSFSHGFDAAPQHSTPAPSISERKAPTCGVSEVIEQEITTVA